MREWSRAFLEQAKSDLKAANSLAASTEYASQTTMLLQMAWEKLAKAALVLSGSWDPMRRKHDVAARFISVLKRMPQAQAVLFAGPSAQFRARMVSLQDDLLALEKLTPALSQGGINAEYPWRQTDASGNETVCWPSKHLSPSFSLSERSSIRVRKDFDSIVSNFDRIFG